VQFADFVAKTLCGTGMMLVEPASGDPGAPEASGNGPRVVTLLVGPEGGWTPEEISAAVRAGYRTWTLGERTLRADAAALVGLAVLLARLGDL
jgi:16S rRNA (uracil1498-N3)-methyltransferase